jgi:hypothetical protein
MFDATAPEALDKFVSVLEYLLTPSSKIWARLVPEDEELRKDRDTKIYFEQVTDIVFKYIYNAYSGFVTQNQEVYESLGAYGNGSVWIDALKKEPGVRFRCMPVGETYWRENHQRMIDCMYRHFWFTARQAAQEWPKEWLPESIQAAIDSDQPDKKFRFLHVVKPQEDMDSERVDYRGMEYVSCYIAYEHKWQIGEMNGFRTFPAAVARYRVRSGDLYGYGPSMDTLPAIKMLNQMAKVHIKQGHRAVDPPLLAHGEEGALGAFSLRPGAINYGFLSPEGRPLLQPLQQGNLVENEKMMAWQKAIIDSAHLVNVFFIFQENPQMTATEVIERSEQMGIFLAPKAGALQSSYCGAIIVRVVDLLWQQGLLPPMPRALIAAGGKYTAEYESPIIQLQKMGRAAATERQLQSAVALATSIGRPDVLDLYDFDRIQRDTADIRGVPTEHLRSDDDIAADRQAREEQAAQQAAVIAAPGAAALMKGMAAVGKEPAGGGQ